MSARGRGGGGRGAYYKARYGGGRERGKTGGGGESAPTPVIPAARRLSKDWNNLLQDCQNIDQQGYGAYKRLLDARYQHGDDFTLEFLHVQGDPYAPPSRVRVIKPVDKTGLPTMHERDHRVATADFITRLAADFIRAKSMNQNAAGGGGWAGPKGGAFNINAPGQEVLERTSCIVNPTEATVELRFTVALPAQGRSILGRQAWTILGENMPPLVNHCLKMNASAQHAGLKEHVDVVRNQEFMRDQLSYLKLVSFIADGAILPRQSGGSTLPMDPKQAVPFESPASLRVHVRTLNGGDLTGMGIPKGVTVLTGGGFHGKSTLLEAIQTGMYNQIPGDGREYVVTNWSAVKVRAEDGRSVTGLDITPFISSLPGGRDTKQFTSSDASGSTSMAAGMQEALEVDCKVLLIDEDTAATNLLLRDERMQKLIKAEPITPYVSKAQAIFKQHGVSTVIVVGSCGDYLDIADSVIGMNEYKPEDLTSQVKEVITTFPRKLALAESYGNLPSRSVSLDSAIIGSRVPTAASRNFIKLFPEARNAVSNPAEAESGIDLSHVEQLVEPGQARLIAEIVHSLASSGQAVSVFELNNRFHPAVMKEGLDELESGKKLMGDLVETRLFEILAAINRIQGLKVQ